MSAQRVTPPAQIQVRHASQTPFTPQGSEPSRSARVGNRHRSDAGSGGGALLENMRACWFVRKTGAAVRASAWREARAKMGVAARRTDIAGGEFGGRIPDKTDGSDRSDAWMLICGGKFYAPGFSSNLYRWERHGRLPRSQVHLVQKSTSEAGPQLKFPDFFSCCGPDCVAGGREGPNRGGFCLNTPSTHQEYVVSVGIYPPLIWHQRHMHRGPGRW